MGFRQKYYIKFKQFWSENLCNLTETRKTARGAPPRADEKERWITPPLKLRTVLFLPSATGFPRKYALQH